MWFPTNTQKKIEAQMALIEECFIKYYGEKYRDKISKKFKEFFFIVVHHSLFSEELFFSDKKNKIITRHTEIFLNRLGIKGVFDDSVLLRIYENLINNDIESLMDNIEEVTKKELMRPLFLLKYRAHVMDYNNMKRNIERDLSNLACYDDFVEIMRVTKKFHCEYLKEISDVLSDDHKKLLFSSSNNIDCVLHKLKAYLPKSDFESSTIEFCYQNFGIDYVNNILLPEGAKEITDEDIEKIGNSRIRIKNEFFGYLHKKYEEYLKGQLISNGIDEDIELEECINPTCFFKERIQNGQKSIYSIIVYPLPFNDCTIIHELNHHIEAYITPDGRGTSGWLPTKKEYEDQSEFLSGLFTEIINDLISEEITKLMHDCGIYIISDESRSDADYQAVRPLVETFFTRFKDIIIESRIGENQSILFEQLGGQNLKDLNGLLNEAVSHEGFSFNANPNFFHGYQSTLDDILQRMAEYKEKKRARV